MKRKSPTERPDNIAVASRDPTISYYYKDTPTSPAPTHAEAESEEGEEDHLENQTRSRALARRIWRENDEAVSALSASEGVVQPKRERGKASEGERAAVTLTRSESTLGGGDPLSSVLYACVDGGTARTTSLSCMPRTSQRAAAGGRGSGRQNSG